MPKEQAIDNFGGTILRGTEEGRIRRLKGFLKGVHHEPDGRSSAADSFVCKIGGPAIEERAEALYRQLREAFGWKRTELRCSFEGGRAVLQTPDFFVNLWVEQHPEDARAFRITLEVSGFRRAEVVRDPTFLAVFQMHCDSVVIEFPGSIEIESRIDAAEESERLRPFLDYPSDASWLSLRASGADGVTMRLEPHQVSFSIPHGGDLAALIEGTQRLLNEFSSAGAGLQLDGAK